MTRQEDEIPQKQDNPELQELKRLRREFHRHPELAWTEFWTTGRILHYLEEEGYDLRWGRELYKQENSPPRVSLPSQKALCATFLKAQETLENKSLIKSMEGGFTGALASIAGTRGTRGPKLGFRFDIDALPIFERQEENSEHLPAREGFAAQGGSMHACGHDGHIAMGLGLARRVAKNRDTLKGNFLFLFQPAEEVTGGGKVFATLPEVRELDYLVAIHLGVVEGRKLICGLNFLFSRKYEVVFRGRSAHAGMAPDLGRNALQAACAAVQGLYGIPRHGKGVSRVNVGNFHSGNARNVISDRASFHLDLRGENEDICNFMEKQAVDILVGAAQMHRVDLEYSIAGESITVPGTPQLRRLVREAALAVGVPAGAVLDQHLAMGSEDAPYLLDAVQKAGGKGAFICLGSQVKGGHHNPEFDFDEDLLLWGVDILWELVKILTGV